MIKKKKLDRQGQPAKRSAANPYLVTSLVFLGMLLFGHFFLYWGESALAYILLLYLIVTLGIRLDDISRLIGTSFGRPTQIPEDEENIIGQLSDLRTEMAKMTLVLEQIRDGMENRTPSVESHDQSNGVE